VSDCSGLIDNETKCRHGFPVYPSCRKDPMKNGTYKGVPCINDEIIERLYPDTGTPDKTIHIKHLKE